MVQTYPGPEAQLTAFDLRDSARGRLARYAGERVAYFRARQSVTLIGALSLALLHSFGVGLAAAALLLLGDLVDCGVLRQVPRWQKQGRPFEWMRTITTLAAGFQAMTVGGCILLVIAGGTGTGAAFFALTVLTGAAIDAAVLLPHHPAAARARLAIYMLTGVAGLAADVALSGGLQRDHGYALMGVLLMACIMRLVLRSGTAAQRNHVKASRDLLVSALALEQSNKALQDTQREARELEMVARHANDGVILSDNRGRIVWVNGAFENMTGYALAEAAGRETGDLLNGPEASDETVQAARAAVREARPLRADIPSYTRDGRTVWVDIRIVPVCDGMGRTETVIAILRDISAARTHARDLMLATSRAEDAARAKAAFLATMSREIRTPMNGIIGMSDLLSETPLDPQQRDYVGAITTSGEALLRILDDILDYSGLDGGKVTAKQEWFNLSRCIRMSSDLLRGAARDKGLFLDICHEVALPEIVVGDEGRVRQVLLNLMGNAIRFTQTGGVTLRVSAERVGATHLIRISLSDTGTGVPESHAERIFDQFEQTDMTPPGQGGGTGLGLSISRQLARCMGGDVILEPGDGVGSVFVFTFRTGIPARDLPPLPQAAVHSAMPDLTGVTILLAEDNRTSSLLVARYLSDLGVNLWFAGNGHEALEMVRQHQPAIVLMDVSMPGLDGLTATVRMRQSDGPQPHVIALTASAFESDRAACFAAGMDDFLAKPIRKADLLAALARGMVAHKPLGSPPTLRVSR